MAVARKDIDYTQYSKLMGGGVPRSRKYGPTLDFKPNFAYDMPETIDPKSWAKVTPGERKAHSERREIRGRLRREFWSKIYHPVKGIHFFPSTGDPMYAKFGWGHSVYHVMESAWVSKWMSSSPGSMKTLLFAIVIPAGIFTYFMKKRGENPKLQPVVQDL